MAKKKKVTTTVTTTVTEEIINVPTNEKTHIICILDRSGSMANIMSDSIGGFNEFLKQQKNLPDEATITIALFDDRYEIIYDNIDIKEAELLTPKIWYPRGSTALYDAIGKTIYYDIAAFEKQGNEKPAKVLVCIVTDGQENSSREYNLDAVKDLIKKCEKDNWNFIYLAANQNAFEVGTSFGVAAGNTFTYTASGAGVSNMTATLNNASINYRSMTTNNANFEKLSKSLIINSKDVDEDGNTLTTSNGTTTTTNIVSNT
jgi:hypothetical protein